MGVISRLFGLAKKNTSGPMTGEEAMKIINAYGKTLAERKSSYGDISELPYPKERIKEALIYWIKEGDDPKVRELLKASLHNACRLAAGIWKSALSGIDR